MRDLPNSLVPVLVPDVVVEEGPFGRRGDKSGVHAFGNVGVLVDGAADEFDLQHAPLRVVPNASEVTR